MFGGTTHRGHLVAHLCFIVISVTLSTIVCENREKRQLIRWNTHYNNKWNTTDEHGHLTIYYKIEASYSDTSKADLIRHSMNMWQDMTCINMIEVPKEQIMQKHHLIFTNNINAGCSSEFGMAPSSSQETHINLLEKGCFTSLPGPIIQKIGHVLGLANQHQRQDRDYYITVHHGNLDRQYKSLADTKNVMTHGVRYDLSSVMHYDARMLAANKSFDAFTTVDHRFRGNIGNADGMTFFDAKIINIEYCKDACEDSETHCTRGGYPDPRDCAQCNCIEGFKYLCNTVDDSDPECPSAGEVYVTSESFMCISLGRYSHGRTCNWHFKTTVGKTIDFKLDERAPFEILCGEKHEGFACRHYVEINYKGQLDKRGPRVCCKSPLAFNGAEGYVTSDNNEILVTFRSVMPVPGKTWAGFTMCFRQSNG